VRPLFDLEGLTAWREARLRGYVEPEAAWLNSVSTIKTSPSPVRIIRIDRFSPITPGEMGIDSKVDLRGCRPIAPRLSHRILYSISPFALNSTTFGSCVSTPIFVNSATFSVE
jgi:hypothetical protein